MDTNNHPLIGKLIERVSGKGSPMTVAHVYMKHELRVVVIDGGGVISSEPLANWNWRIVTPDPAAEPTTAAPQPDADGWIPLDGSRFPDVPADVRIAVRLRDGGEFKGSKAGDWEYSHTGGDIDIIAWKRA